MEVKEAKYILAIAKYKSINKAAKALYISQPSLSRYLQNLEFRMNTKLFSHIHNEYVPTYMGMRYLHYAKKMVELENEWNAEYRDIMNVKKGQLNIAIPIVRSNCLIPDSVAEFHQKYPNVDVNVYEAAHSVEQMLLEESNLDLAVYNVSTFPKHLEYQIIGRSEIVLVMHQDHPTITKAVKKKGYRHPWIDIRDLEGENFVLLYEQQTTGKVIQELFDTIGMNPNVWMRTRSSEVAISMAQKNAGITLAAEGYVEHMGPNSREVVCLSTGDQQIYTTMIAAYRPGQYLPGYVQDYIDIVKSVMDGRLNMKN
ncbi:MAG: LysR family transcriptional regulator [Faecalicatena sp.]|uniref:LysR family transcriptional regulator n=1 Tax=Faecalicatena sp. TaxID=2005360 RepID=UPI0025906B80|nr:LysR family transcriptional regulator [Faecalicatena sp.]MCI6465582.1 LysR family transcriptional regulator [Faecalicatena sp.]MDY5617414.1 LysR family transcriptional regulator [Lachnospiraceae bacterium]